jgi:hypothetical protein
MLEKMGFKEGQKLGKEGSSKALSEPIQVEIKANKHGIAFKTRETEKKELHAKYSAELTEAFVSIKRSEYLAK